MGQTYSKNLYLTTYKNDGSLAKAKTREKYLDVMKRLNSVYDQIESGVRRQYAEYRNAAGAQSAISKQNSAAVLSQKGLSKSGESVQNEILGEMAFLGTLNSLAAKESQELSNVNANRASALSGVQNDMINAENEQEKLEYQKERDLAADQKWQKEFDYNASRDGVADYKWQKDAEYKEKRDAESDRKWNFETAYNIERDNKNDALAERQQQRKELDSDRDYSLAKEKLELQRQQNEKENELSARELDIRRENYLANAAATNRELSIKEQYLALEKAQQNSTESTANTKSSRVVNDDKIGYTINENGYIVPELSPSKFVELVIEGNGLGTWANGEFIRPQTLRQRMTNVLNDESIDPDYRKVMKMYAKARGIVD